MDRGSTPTQDGYPAFLVSPNVKTFQGYGLGSYSFFNTGVAIQDAMAFQAPDTQGVQFHDVFTQFLNGSVDHLEEISRSVRRRG